MNQDSLQEQNNEHMQHGGSHNSQHGKSVTEKVNVDWKVNPLVISQGEEVEIVITVKNKNGAPTTAFAIVHEKQMHLLAISKDLSSFQHLHPEYKREGEFKVSTHFPHSDTYKLFADFMPEGGAQQLKSFEIQVGNEKSISQIKLDEDLNKTIKDLAFELKFDSLVANHDINMTFTITKKDGKEPITQLEPYLGSAGHVVIVSEDLKKFLHVHPTDEKITGPIVSYMTSFPEPGIYKIWGQFKYKGAVYTVPFVIQVPSN
ncbi:hypothetical protein SAMN05880501_11390 [Ureibacillus xyleni]|uniref:Secreted protein n=1 Tax=Ureibacillus xyleni TaxID=614648 RepID=A0A285TI17_9BACL|nr:hypothetical protein [Ureibacillus xyleni]SOC21919.1 hypothetical protein SAMN05880501_11390 [Ureibacillus xyleni]